MLYRSAFAQTVFSFTLSECLKPADIETDNSDADVNLSKLKMPYIHFPNELLQQLVVLKSNGASAVKSHGFS